MSLNAFYSAYGNTQNALGDPRGDARKREQEDMKNAILQREMQMKEYEFGQKQSEAQRLERQRQLEQERLRRRAAFVGGEMFPSRTPATPAPSMPAVGGAPVEPVAQGQSFIDPTTGQEGASYTATAQSRGAMPTQEEIMDFEMKDAWDRGDKDYFDTLVVARRQRMTEEEKQGRQQIAVAAGQILRMPAEQRAAAVMQALQQYGVDPEMTKVDDYINDPIKLESALKFEMMRGDPEEAMKENIRVQGTFDQFRPFERQDLGNRVGVFNPQTGQFGEGPRIGLSPNTQATVGATIRGQNINRELGQGRLELEREAVDATKEWMGGGAVSQMSNEELLAIVAAARGGR